MGLSIDQDISGTGGPWTPDLVGGEFARIGACGKSFGRGIFRFHDSTSGPVGQQAVETARPDLAGQVAVFAFDWLARQYCVVGAVATPSGRDEVVVIDPFDLSIQPVVHHGEFLGFLSSPLMVELVGPELFETWLSATELLSLRFDRCAAATVPAFLGGRLEVSNLEESDIDVYWTVTVQAFLATQHLPDGSSVTGFNP